MELEEHVDERGSFARTWCRDEMADAGLTSELAQCSLSRNPRAGTLRGLHFQRAPHEEAKLVRCTRGAIFDVAVDLRPGSPTRGTWFGVRLDSESGRALYVPEGCAHGFQTLVDESDVAYMISTPYAPEASSRRPLGRPDARDRVAEGRRRADDQRARPGAAGLRAELGLSSPAGAEQTRRRASASAASRIAGNGSPERAGDVDAGSRRRPRGSGPRGAPPPRSSRPRASGTGRVARAAARRTATC